MPAIVSLDGATKLEVPGVPSDAIFLSLSADGHKVAFVTWDTHIAVNCGACSARSRLAVIGTDGTKAHALKVPLR